MPNLVGIGSVVSEKLKMFKCFTSDERRRTKKKIVIGHLSESGGLKLTKTSLEILWLL